MDLTSLANAYLKGNKLMQLATIAEGQPWLSNVYFVSDGWNLYWTSARSRRHSKEIQENPRVAATIVQDAERKQALQITGEAREVPIDDVIHVNKLYGEKFGDKPSRLEEVLANTPTGRAYWVLEIRTLSLWDEVNFPTDPKQEVRNF